MLNIGLYNNNSTSLLQTSLDIVITLKSINLLYTTSSLDIRVVPATRTRGEGGQRLPSPLVHNNNNNYERLEDEENKQAKLKTSLK